MQADKQQYRKSYIYDDERERNYKVEEAAEEEGLEIEDKKGHRQPKVVWKENVWQEKFDQ